MKELFLDQDHKEIYQNFFNLANVHKSDKERKAFFFILSGNEETTKEINNIYNFQENRLQLNTADDEIKGFNISSSSKDLIKLACNLYNSSFNSFSVVDVFKNLDDDDFHLAISAIRIRFEPYLKF